MADPVNSPLLSVTPTESSGVKSAKSGNSVANSGDNGDTGEFSRVLHTQRSRDSSPAKSTDESSSNTEAGGKSLPPEGNNTAEPENTGSAVAADKGAAAKDDGIAKAAAIADAGQNTSAADAPGLTEQGAGRYSVSFDDSPVLQFPVASAGESEVGARPEQRPAAVNLVSAPATVAGADKVLTQAELAAATDTASSNADSSVSPAGPAPANATQFSTNTSLSGVANTPVSTPESAGRIGALAGPFPGDAVGPPLGANPAPASSSPAAASVATSTAMDDPALLATSTASAAALKEGDLLPKSSVGGETLSRYLGANAPERGAALQMDSGALNRSTADWLRSGMGSEASGQRGLAELQLDTAADLTRGLAASSRGDGAVLAPGASTVAGLAPASSAASAAMPAATGAAAAMPEYSLARAPDDTEFPSELTARMKTLVRDGVREARLNLHPAELGRLQVTVTTEGDQTRVAFTAETLAARDAIEQSMPRLREMLEQSGLQLAQSDVGQRDLQGNGGQSGDGQFGAQQDVAEAAEADAPVLVTPSLGNSRIDTYI